MFKRLLYALLVCAAAPCFAQPAIPWRDTTRLPYSTWIGGGVGVSSIVADQAGNINFEIGRHGLLTFVEQIEVTDFKADTRTEIKSYNFLYGRVGKRYRSLYHLSAGLGIIEEHKFPADTRRSTVNVPILLQHYWVIDQGYGIGFCGYANLNTVQPTCGINLNIALGYMFTHMPDEPKPEKPSRKRTKW